MPRATGRIDWFAVTLVGSFAALLGFMWLLRFVPSPLEQYTLVMFNVELAPLQARFEADGRHSIGVEEWVVRDYFNDKRDGVFLDVGSADPIEHSNTYFLEAQRGWSGVAVDALPEFAPAYRRDRPRTQFVSIFVSDQDDAHLNFYFLPERPLSSSGDAAFAEKWKNRGPVETRSVQTITLNTLLTKMNLPRVDFLSMDIEMYEPKALAGFDIERWRPRLVGIEAHPEIRQELMAYFAAHDYVLVGRYLRLDLQNLWFVPADGPLPAANATAHTH